MTKKEQREILGAEARAWRAMAERIDRSDWREHGICAEICTVRDIRLEHPMRTRLASHMEDHALAVKELRYRLKASTAPREWGHSIYDCEEDGLWMNTSYLDQPGRAESRVLFCLFLALECDDEAAAL
jgi:hypothetical protein